MLLLEKGAVEGVGGGIIEKLEAVEDLDGVTPLNPNIELNPILGLGELSVNPRQLVDRRGDPKTSHVRRQQLVIKRVGKNFHLEPRILPIDHPIHLALIQFILPKIR